MGHSVKIYRVDLPDNNHLVLSRSRVPATKHTTGVIELDITNSPFKPSDFWGCHCIRYRDEVTGDFIEDSVRGFRVFTNRILMYPSN